ncbi:MAG TPA: VIT domain-containing protein [Steroidobacteraceae bacterium]|nr:VIT domain-containing protein [Steroidobacteraceae bacterium]
MNAESCPCLRTGEGARVPLTRVAARGRVDGLLFELTVEQHYRNTSTEPIEAVYTFALPLHAVLLAFELDLNGTKHVATAFGRQQAERRYENAIDEGDSAALLLHNGNGLYTVNVANLKPAEAAVVRYRYAELLCAHRGQVRLNLPTAIAPRYGTPSDAHLEGAAIPGADVFVEYPFSLFIAVAGITDAARLVSPSHAISAASIDGGLGVAIAGQGYLDRDFVLVIDHPGLPAGTLIAADGEGFVALASAALPATDADRRPLTIKLLLDCSGSMAGQSIAAATRALVRILGSLNDSDRFSLTRFGSDVEHVTEGLEPADPHSIGPVTEIARRLNADMGGTEITGAIRSVLAIPVPEGATADLVLITDGEVYSVEAVVDIAARSAHRLFVVAIGAAPNEALARRVSERTGGACDFVAAGENVEPAILRMVGRLRATPRTIEDIQWSATPQWTAPWPAAVFPDDTIHLIAGFRERPSGAVEVRIAGNRQCTTLTLPIAAHRTGDDVVPRIAAARRLPGLPDAAARDLAIQYQLVCAHTSLVLVAERASGDKVNGLPRTIAVPHMLAAGWGGTGYDFTIVGRPPAAPAGAALHRRLSAAGTLSEPDPAPSYAAPARLDVPAFLRSAPAGGVPVNLPESLRGAIVEAVVRALSQGGPLPESIDALHALAPLPEDLRNALHSRHGLIGGSESEFVEALLRFLDRDQGRLDSILPCADRARNHRFRELRRQFTQWIHVEPPAGSRPG